MIISKHVRTHYTLNQNFLVACGVSAELTRSLHKNIVGLQFSNHMKNYCSYYLKSETSIHYYQNMLRFSTCVA